MVCRRHTLLFNPYAVWGSKSRPVHGVSETRYRKRGCVPKCMGSRTFLRDEAFGSDVVQRRKCLMAVSQTGIAKDRPGWARGAWPTWGRGGCQVRQALDVGLDSSVPSHQGE